MNEQKKVYLSMPITGHDMKERRQLAARTAATLMYEHEDWLVVNPFHIYDRMKAELLAAGDFSEPHYEDLLATDLEVLRTCKAAYFMQGWESSNGCKREMQFCREQNIEVIFEMHNA